MSSLSISCIVFACIFGGTVLGMVLRVFLPEKHLSAESREVVKLGMGLVGTMTALVLGLLIASAKGSFDIQRNGLAELSANIILLDRVLAHYGPESKDARDMLRASVADMLQHAWPQENPRSGQAETKVRTEGRYEGLYEKIRELAPKSDAQRALQAQALKTGIDIAQTRLADVHTERQFDSDSVSGADGLLAHSHSRQLQPAGALQCDCLQHPAGLRVGGVQCGLSDSGIGSAVRWNDSDFQRSVAPRPRAPGTVGISV